MISKAEINAILKNLGLGYVKASQGEFDYRDVVLEPRMKGLRGGSIGPLTVTDAYMNVNERTQDKVRDAFKVIPGVSMRHVAGWPESHRIHGLEIEIPISEKVVRVLKFNWERVNTYVGRRYDPEYRTYWYIMTTEDRKI